ncbi:hypothetical protein HK097_005255 [Rhizophlyctis rosea]|uniref:Uncharacterized protein n=1 Tax=Rhizophlyctis rosea TaxID=64517 RepID=A0AAD5SF18_9FUNG|nr:hypothetical protein HK097_005255 [Rhizophlyctis rosea]
MARTKKKKPGQARVTKNIPQPPKRRVKLSEQALIAAVQIWSTAHHEFLSLIATLKTPPTKTDYAFQPQWRHLIPFLTDKHSKRHLKKEVDTRPPPKNAPPISRAVKKSAKYLRKIGHQIRALNLSHTDEKILATLVTRDFCQDATRRAGWLTLVSKDVDAWIESKTCRFDLDIMAVYLSEELHALEGPDTGWSSTAERASGEDVIGGHGRADSDAEMEGSDDEGSEYDVQIE